MSWIDLGLCNSETKSDLCNRLFRHKCEIAKICKVCNVAEDALTKTPAAPFYNLCLMACLTSSKKVKVVSWPWSRQQQDEEWPLQQTRQISAKCKICQSLRCRARRPEQDSRRPLLQLGVQGIPVKLPKAQGRELTSISATAGRKWCLTHKFCHTIPCCFVICNYLVRKLWFLSFIFLYVPWNIFLSAH